MVTYTKIGGRYLRPLPAQQDIFPPSLVLDRSGPWAASLASWLGRQLGHDVAAWGAGALLALVVRRLLERGCDGTVEVDLGEAIVDWGRLLAILV